MEQNILARSYLHLRNMIGFLGIGLPVFCFVGGRIWGCSFTQPSLSHYFYSSMHFCFVGTLAVLGFFLVLYKGNGLSPKINRLENWLSTIAGVSAILVGMFPTNIDSFCDGNNMQCVFINAPTFERVPWVETIHFSAAAALFLCFVLICLLVFTQSDDFKSNDSKKAKRNLIYRICAAIIVVALSGLFIISKLAGMQFVIKYRLVYWAEFISLIAFGVAWLIKGSQLWVGHKNKFIYTTISWIR